MYNSYLVHEREHHESENNLLCGRVSGADNRSLPALRELMQIRIVSSYRHCQDVFKNNYTECNLLLCLGHALNGFKTDRASVSCQIYILRLLFGFVSAGHHSFTVTHLLPFERCRGESRSRPTPCVSSTYV